MVIDAHNHFWKYDQQKYNWISDEMSVLQQDCFPGDMKPMAEKFNVEGLVAVQATQNKEENDFLLNLAEQDPLVKGVVGWVDLTADDLADRLQDLSIHPKFVGIRHMIQSEPDPEFMLRKDFQRGIALLMDYQLTYDILIDDRLLPVTTSFVEKFPDQKFVLDHIAKPPIKAGKLYPWETNIRQLAKNTHVNCKISGLVTEADWNSWKEDDIKPFLDVVFDAFGPDRLMFGSDFPVCLLAADYERVIGLVQKYIKEFSIQDQEKIMAQNAVDFYGLEVG